jgi:hypothetical protein
MTMSRSEALTHCIEVLGWKNAFIPKKRVREDMYLDEDTVYEYAPTGCFDTPRTFFYGEPLDLNKKRPDDLKVSGHGKSHT